MALSKEEAQNIKSQLLGQIAKMPPEQAGSMKDEIEAMSPDELEEFVEKNTQPVKEGKQQSQECVFCSIIQGRVPAYKIDENKTSIAILEINPLSYGHSMIVSKKHDKLSSSAFSLANKLAKRIKSKLKADDVKIESVKILGHEIVQVIPAYKGKPLEKKQATERELILLQDKLKAKKRVKKQKQVLQEKPLEKAPRRIP